MLGQRRRRVAVHRRQNHPGPDFPPRRGNRENPPRARDAGRRRVAENRRPGPAGGAQNPHRILGRIQPAVAEKNRPAGVKPGGDLLALAGLRNHLGLQRDDFFQPVQRAPGRIVIRPGPRGPKTPALGEVAGNFLLANQPLGEFHRIQMGLAQQPAGEVGAVLAFQRLRRKAVAAAQHAAVAPAGPAAGRARIQNNNPPAAPGHFKRGGKPGQARPHDHRVGRTGPFAGRRKVGRGGILQPEGTGGTGGTGLDAHEKIGAWGGAMLAETRGVRQIKIRADAVFAAPRPNARLKPSR